MSNLNAYKKTAVTTASKEQLLLMLYEAAIKHLKRAGDCCQKNDLAGKGMAVGKAHDIINELLNTLDFNAGGDIARKLESLYNFMIEEIMKGNMENDVTRFAQVQKLMENLLEGWKGAIAQVQTEKGLKRG